MQLNKIRILVWSAVCLGVATTTVSADANDLGLGPTGHKGIRYAGPIVYTNEKPPIIHFPPPPRVSSVKGFQGTSAKGKSVKYVPMPTHDLPILIYTSDVKPPLHVVPSPAGVSHSPKREYKTNTYEHGGQMRADYSEQVAQYTHTAPKSETKKRPVEQMEKYRTVEARPSAKSYSSSSGSGRESSQGSYYSRRPFAQTIRDFLEQSSNQLRSYYVSPSPSSRPKSAKRKDASKNEGMMGDFSSNREVYAKPKAAAPKAAPSSPSSPLPHIIYTGHAPIHIFNQAPIYVPNSNSKPQGYVGSPSTKSQSYVSPKSDSETQQAEYSAPRPTYLSKTRDMYGKIKDYYRPDKKPYGGKNYASSSSSSSSSYSSSYRAPSKPKPTSYTYKQQKQSSYRPSNPSKPPTTNYNSGSYQKELEQLYTSPKKPSNRQPSASSNKPRRPSQPAPAKQYSSAPPAFKKPPIIIYQGLYPPHHVYENPAPSVDYRLGQPVDSSVAAASNVEEVAPITAAEAPIATQQITDRMSFDAGVPVSTMEGAYGLVNSQAAVPAYWLPPFGMTVPEMYVSDLTSQGTTAPFSQFYSVHPTQSLGGGGVAGVSTVPQTHTIQMQNQDGSYSTAQPPVLTIKIIH